MWNTMILPILTSLIATGLGIFLVWLFNRKKQSDESANQITRILNDIDDIRNKIANSSERLELETAKNEKFRADIKAEVQGIRTEVHELKAEVQEVRTDVQEVKGQVSENRALLEKINGQVAENRELIQNLMSIVADLQSIVRDSIVSR